MDLLSNLQMQTDGKYFKDSWLTKASDNITTLQFYIFGGTATCSFSMLITSFALVDNYPYWYICCLSENSLWV